MSGFITWAILGEYVSFITLVYMVVEFTKEIPFIKRLSTKYWSAIVSFVLLALTSLHAGSFAPWDITLYILSAISISLGANGLSNFNAKKPDTSTTVDTTASVNASDAVDIVTDVPPTTPTV